MKKKNTIILALIFVAAAVWAHSPLLYIEDNYNGTIIVEGGFSNGASAAALPVIIVEDKDYKGPDKSFEGKRILYETVFDDLGCAEMVKPDVEGYNVIFNGGPGHTITLKGPALEDDERKDWNMAIEERSDELGRWKSYITGDQ